MNWADKPNSVVFWDTVYVRNQKYLHGWHGAPSGFKYGVEESTKRWLLHHKFHPHRCRGGCGTSKLKILPLMSCRSVLLAWLPEILCYRSICHCRVSVRLSHAGIVPKRLNVGSCFLMPKILVKFQRCYPQWECQIQLGLVPIGDFQPKSHYISEMCTRMGHNYYKALIGTHMHYFKWPQDT